MKLEFLGTRGNIEPKRRLHKRHSALLVSYKRRRVMVDCGEDWLGALEDLRPHAIVLTHAHSDHVGGLAEGAPCPVYATRETWERIDDYPIEERHTLAPDEKRRIEGMTFTACPVIHSVNAPAVGYLVSAGRVTVFYVPDVAEIERSAAVFAGVRIYIGDGASLTRPLLRRQEGQKIGHTTVGAQIEWCAEAGVDRAIFTHCGSEIVKQDEASAAAAVARKGERNGVEATLAHDGLECVLR